MDFNEITKKIMGSKELADEPPVLIDIGASGEIHPKWTLIAPYSICIAADADGREMEYSEQADSRYRKLFVIHRVLTDTDSPAVNFYLTKSPYCSSSLPPNIGRLAPWDFAGLFSVEEVVKLPAKSLVSTLRELGIERVDWFKTDSQGTDLRLFTSLPEESFSKVLVVEFEPGVLDSYHGEDKLWQVLAHMEKRPYWMSSLELHGPKRISQRIREKSGMLNIAARLRDSPGWAEITYLAEIDPHSSWSKREYLLHWLFSCLEKQFGFAAEVANIGSVKYPDPLFGEMECFALSKLFSSGRDRLLFKFQELLQHISSKIDWLLYR